MIGSGIFVLPGLAMAEAGPAVILAFLIAGVLVIPAALAISELGTAMPEAGGDYVFIERGMGPAVGTVAGIDTWLTLLFKGALALVGGMVYLDLLVRLPNHTAAALALAALLIGSNPIGVKQTGQLQTYMVVILTGFVTATITRVESASYEPFFLGGFDGLTGASALVIVSYAGVTKVASVAGARIRFVFAAGPDASAASVETIREYHAELDARCSVPVEGGVIRSDDEVEDLLGELTSADLVVLSTEIHRLLPDRLFSPDTGRIATRLEQPVLFVHSRKSRRTTFREPVVERVLFRE
ncbi:MAG: APC family permease [Halalkalicoccus sp.]